MDKTRDRVFTTGEPNCAYFGDLVLVLIPTAECKFLAKWQGPYEVVDRVGDPAGSLPAYGPPVRRPRRTRHVPVDDGPEDNGPAPSASPGVRLY